MKKALIVDDEPLIRQQVTQIVADYGFDELYEAADGSQAIALAAVHRPLLTVMDVTMPVMDGITAADKMNRTPSGAIVLLTGIADSETVTRAHDAGVHHYLMKPFNAEQLRITIDLSIHQFIEISNLRDEVAALKENLETRKLVDRAKGVLIKRGLTEPEAHRKMQKLAMNKRKSLKEVAEAFLLMEG
ncbi:response regulator receiver and ANTAR domain protein [Desulfuromusa kysingii]|uniref:Response regulator receiver and ANTAR domain protein n=1 Tax=Desulfuromusa kysingii TaxID=37625 RepID=A0A1H4DIU3_9BACT|nr:response regulator [Desulfuromusa kysingii]SEA72763.1 response regulator receiver and ANTAR domain protein [Desulfuromusa kysingii]